MRPFSSKSAMRILILTSNGLHTLAWRNNTLAPTEYFTQDDQGIAGFRQFLAAQPNVPCYLLVDCIEEDFRVETMPHAVGNDRNALLQRKLSQFFRTTEYRSARVQGREKSGRRDDRVLFSALTNSSLISPWVNGMIDNRVQLQGISSTAMLMELFVKYLRLDEIPHLLLVSLEQFSGVRHTYLQGGCLKFSRLTSLGAIEAARPEESIPVECRHTRQYLERLNLLPRNQLLNIYLFTPDETRNALGKSMQESALQSIYFLETESMAAAIGLEPSPGHGPVFLCLAKALRARGLANVYGPASSIRYHRIRKFRKGLISSAGLVVLATAIAGISLVREGLDHLALQRQLDRETLAFERQYQEARKNFPETPINAAVMKNLVEKIDLFQRQAFSPAHMMNLVSRAMAACPDILLQRLDWQMTTPSDMAEELSVAEQYNVLEGDGGQGTISELLPTLFAGRAGIATVLHGIVQSAGGHQAAHHSISRFITVLEEFPGLKTVPLAMPIDTSPDTIVKATLDGVKLEAKFSLKLEYQPTP